MKRWDIGQTGEAIAKSFLQANGYDILALNWRHQRLGEIDIIAYHPQKHRIAFIEVKTRRSDKFGHPIESITYTKQHKIKQLAEVFLQRTVQHDPRLNDTDVTFDVITITPTHEQRGQFTLDHTESAF